MKQIRKSVFETNSSSCHSICIQKKEVIPGDYINFRFDEYSWDEDEVCDTASYLYTLIMNTCDEEVQEARLYKLKSILDSHNIKYDFEEPMIVEYSYGYSHLEVGCVDHACEGNDFINAVLNDEDLLFRYLFGADSCVYTGNDNSCENDSMCWAADPKIWDDESGKMIDNPNHKPDEYDYFYKGN
jgi:hypothetical protein